jgi:hypothetical protein
MDALLKRFPGLADADAVCWTGSTAVGWSNPLSDVDIYAFSDQPLVLPEDETSETRTSNDRGSSWFAWMGRYEDVCADLQVWPTDALETILRPYLSPDEPEWCELNDRMQEFVYRVSIAVPCKNDTYFDRMRELIGRSSYHRALARNLKALAETQLNDVAGQIAAEDYLTATSSAVLAAYTSADHCLVLAGELCRKRKFLLHRIEAAPACGITVDEYRAEVLSGPRDGESEYDYAARVARWAQAQLIRVEPQALTFSK